MFKMLKEVLLNVSGSLANTNYLRIILIASIVIPLVITLYGYLDEIIENANEALNNIQDISGSYQGKTFNIGTYAISFLGLAKFDICLVTVFGYVTSAIVWSFTYDLKPMFVRK